MDTLGVLLTGGLSRRMGRDKATLPLPGGETLAERSARVMGQVFDRVVEIGPGVSGATESIPDESGLGPLAALGLVVGPLAVAGRLAPCVVCAVDLPLLSPATLAWLRDFPPPSASVVPVVGGHPQYLLARYSPVALLGGLVAVARRSSAVRVLSTHGDVLYPAAEGPSFEDADTPEEWARIVGS